VDNGHSDFDAQFIDQFLQVFFEDVVTRTLPPPHRRAPNCGCMGIIYTAVRKPPRTNAIADELAGIFAQAQMQVAKIALHIVNAMRDDHLFRKAIEIVVESVQLFTGVEMPVTVKLPKYSFFLTSKLMIGLPTALKSATKVEILTNCSSDAQPISSFASLRLPTMIAMLLEQLLSPHSCFTLT